jgi:16S rRNA (cytosine967-C5)-methyltransferase
MQRVQHFAARSVGEVLGAGCSLTAALTALRRDHRELAAAELAAIQDLSYGVLRFYGPLAALLEILAARPQRDARVKWLLLVALYQSRFSEAQAYAVVDGAVAAAARYDPHSKGFVNAVLRRFLRGREPLWKRATSGEVGRFSHPKWWIDKLRAESPEHYASILEAGNQRAPLTLRVNRRRIDTDEYLGQLQHEGIEAHRIGGQAIMLTRPLPVTRIPGFFEGLCSVQDEGAQRAAGYLDVHDGMRVLDACAAPGGKAAQILEQAAVSLIALDVDSDRLGKVRENLKRLQLDARLLCTDSRDLGAWWDGVSFDRILLDVPCSASGVARRHPDVKWLRRETDFAQFAELQQQLLDAVWQTLNRDGKLLYVTCSVFQEENQDQADAFMKRHPDARYLPIDDREALDGQLLPCDQHDGFYHALFQKCC